MTHYFLQHYLK